MTSLQMALPKSHLYGWGRPPILGTKVLVDGLTLVATGTPTSDTRVTTAFQFYMRRF